MLPKIDIKYIEVFLPSGKIVNVRPFTGNEEKIMLTAKMSSNDTNSIMMAIVKVLEGCTQEDITSLTSLDYEWLFLNLRAMSVSPDIETAFPCTNDECDHVTPIKFPIANIKKPEAGDQSKKFDVGKDVEGNNITIVMNRPSLKTIIDSTRDENDGEIRMMYSSLEGVYVGSEEIENFSYEDFSEWLLSLKSAYSDILLFFRDQPKIVYDRKYKCTECGHENKVHLEGLTDFFT